jgi:glyoxylate carboligase
MDKASRLAVEKAIKAKTLATAAFIVAGGAMVAAIAGALIAFLALRRYGFRPPW